jgi:hypothetical protein
MTLVKFYQHPVNGDQFALFPQLKAGFNGYRNDLLTCYSHIGQHSSCAPDYVKECRAMKESEYAGLKTELESIGYNLKVVKKSKFGS